MTDRPITFSAPMVRALLEGRKTQTRRELKGRSGILAAHSVVQRGAHWLGIEYDRSWPLRIPYSIGDRLYVREHWRVSSMHDGTAPRDLTPRSMTVAFEAGGSIANQEGRDDWRPSPASYSEVERMGRFRQGIHMPRWASRLTLIVTDVRVQRLQEISEADAVAEGADQIRIMVEPREHLPKSYRSGFENLWNSLHGHDAWDANAWVCALTFYVIRANIDSPETANAQ